MVKNQANEANKINSKNTGRSATEGKQSTPQTERRAGFKYPGTGHRWKWLVKYICYHDNRKKINRDFAAILKLRCHLVHVQCLPSFPFRSCRVSTQSELLWSVAHYQNCNFFFSHQLFGGFPPPPRGCINLAKLNILSMTCCGSETACSEGAVTKRWKTTAHGNQKKKDI